MQRIEGIALVPESCLCAVLRLRRLWDVPRSRVERLDETIVFINLRNDA